MIENCEIIIDDVRQKLIYYLLPKNNTDKLILNLPEVINVKIDEWANNGNKDLYLRTAGSRYTFKNSSVDKQVFNVNRYGIKSRHLTVSYSCMFFGFKRSKA